MQTLFWIAWRFLWGRRSERFVSIISLISIMGIAIGVWALIVVLAVMSGFDRDLKEKIIGNYSHIVVEASSPISDYPGIMDNLKAVKDVEAISPYIQNQALLQSKLAVRGIIVRGIDFELESKVTNIDKYLLNKASRLSHGIFISRELGYLMGIREGEELTMLSPQGKKFNLKVEGVFNSGMYDFDTRVAFVGLGKAQEIFGMGNSINGFDIRITRLFMAQDVKSRLQKILGPYFYVRTWMEYNKNFFAALKLEKITMFIILTLITLVAAFNIVSTLVVMVTEKTRDIGIFKAIGLKGWHIGAIFVLVGLFIGLLGIILGSASGIGSCLLLKKYRFIKLPADIYTLDTLPVSIELWPDIGVILLCAFLITLVSTLYPARKAARLVPVEALRYE